MKRILALFLAALLPLTAVAQNPSGEDISYTCALTQECGALLSSIATSTGTLLPGADNTYDVGSSSLGYRTGYFDTSVITPLLAPTAGLTVQVDADAQRLFTFDASSDTALTQTFGDAGVTAAQTLDIRSATSDADDDTSVRLSGGGAVADANRGAFLTLNGNETSSGSVTLSTGAVSASSTLRLTGASGSSTIAQRIGGTDILTLSSTALTFNTSGVTVALQEATAGAACMGTVTATGTTAVTVSTTCARAGSRILLTRTSAPSGTAQCWWDTLSAGVSFNLDCDGAETGTFNWFILNESA